MHAGDAQLEPHIVEISVAGLNHRFVQIYAAMAPAFPVPVAVWIVFQLVIAGVRDGALPVGDAGIQASNAQHRLDSGAGWVAALQSAIEQRIVRVALVGGVILVGNAGDEQIGVKAGAADKGQYAAIAWVDGHHGATPFAQRFVGGFLNTHGNSQAHVFAGNRGLFLKHAQNPSPGVGFYLTIAHLTMQTIFVKTLNPAAAIEMGAGIIALLVQRHGFQVLAVDAVHVANHVGQGIAVGIMANRVGGDTNAGQPMLVDCQPGDFLFRESSAHGNGFPGASGGLPAFVEPLQITVVKRHHGAQIFDQRIQIRGLLDDDFQGKIRSVFRQDDAVTVGDQTARR